MPVNRFGQRKKAANFKASDRIRFSIVFLTLLFVAIFLTIARSFLSTKYWSKNDRLIIVFQSPENDILISNVDPVAGEIVNLVIPKDTEVEASDNLGKWRVGKLWELGKPDNNSGRLLSRSITTYFNFPVAVWSDSTGLGLISGSLPDLAKALLGTYKTNLTFGDKLRIGFFSRSLDNIQKTTVNLSNTTLLKKSVLSDGSEGYILTGFTPPKLYSYFISYRMKKESLKVVINNKSGSPSAGTKVGKVIESIGGKVVAIEDANGPAEYVCTIDSKERNLAFLISAVFGCSVVSDGSVGVGELRINLGNKFTL